MREIATDSLCYINGKGYLASPEGLIVPFTVTQISSTSARIVAMSPISQSLHYKVKITFHAMLGSHAFAGTGVVSKKEKNPFSTSLVYSLKFVKLPATKRHEIEDILALERIYQETPYSEFT